MAKVTQIEVVYGENQEHKDSIHVRRLRYRQQMRLFAELNKNSKLKLKDDGSVEKDKKGNDVRVFDPSSAADFQVELIATTVCDESGKTLFTPDDVDAWAEEDGGREKIVAYVAAINAELNPSPKAIEGNS